MFGFFAAWLVYEAELHPELWYLALFLFIGATVLSYAGILAVVALIGNLIPASAVLGARLLSAVGTAAYLTGSHRSRIRTVEESQETRPGVPE